jgi:hypothetical protein
VSRDCIRVAIQRANGDPEKIPDLLNEFIRDEAMAMGDRLHQQITEILVERIEAQKGQK